MASTITLQRSITLASAFLRYAPLVLSANDPALSNADWVRQFILSAPFAWWWNRAEITPITTQTGIHDYTVAAENFGWIEKAVLTDPDSGQETQELEVADNLVADTNPNLPTKISVQMSDDAGNITFRLTPAPDQAYVLNIVYQKAAPTFTNLSDTWEPIPDYYSYLFNQGFLAKNAEYLNDPRFVEAMQLFTQMVLSANQGLTDEQKSIFLFDRLNIQRQTQNTAQGRG